MDNSAVPSTEAKPSFPAAYWTTARQELVEWLVRLPRFGPSLAELYQGAVELLWGHSVPGWKWFVGHAVRDIRNRLPECITGPTARTRADATNDVGKLVMALDSAGWSANSLLQHWDVVATENVPQSDSISIPVPAARILANIVRDYRAGCETRSEATGKLFETLDPNPYKRDEIARRWWAATQWFMQRTHVSGEPQDDSDIEQYRTHFELCEAILHSVVGEFFTGLRELDEILDAANS